MIPEKTSLLWLVICVDGEVGLGEMLVSDRLLNTISSNWLIVSFDIKNLKVTICADL